MTELQGFHYEPRPSAMVAAVARNKREYSHDPSRAYIRGGGHN